MTRSDLGPEDLAHLRRAVELSRRGMQAREGGPFGAVVVLEGHVVGEGWNRVTATADPTAHAEVVAIRDACRRVASFELPGATVYASSEPCPMCWSAVHWARCSRVVHANQRDQAAAIGFDDALLYDQLALPAADRSIDVVHHPMDEAAAVFAAWDADPTRVRY